MTGPDDLDLEAAWRDGAASEPRAALDAEAVVARAEHDAARLRREWLTTALATSFAIVVFMGLVLWKRSLVYASLAGFVLPVLVLLGGASAFVHAGERSGLATTVAAHVAGAVRRNRARVRLAQASLATLALLTAGFFGWLPFLAIHTERLTREPWRLGLGVGASLVVFVLAFVASVRVVRAARAELARWEAIARALE